MMEKTDYFVKIADGRGDCFRSLIWEGDMVLLSLSIPDVPVFEKLQIKCKQGLGGSIWTCLMNIDD